MKSRVVKVIINGEKSENGIIPRNAGNLEIQVLIYQIIIYELNKIKQVCFY